MQRVSTPGELRRRKLPERCQPFVSRLSAVLRRRGYGFGPSRRIAEKVAHGVAALDVVHLRGGRARARVHDAYDIATWGKDIV